MRFEPLLHFVNRIEAELSADFPVTRAGSTHSLVREELAAEPIDLFDLARAKEARGRLLR